MEKLNVIFDTDPGVDDAMALLYLARHSRINLVGVTTVFGNAYIDQVTKNAIYLRDTFGFDAPIARGADRPLVIEPDEPPTFVHGHNGLGDVDLPDVDLSDADPRPAHELIIDLVRENPNQITLIAVGRMTNLALAAKQAPDVPALVKQVVIMGGAFGYNGHGGNVSPVAEANIIGDPHAADFVFGLDWPVVIVGLDVTKEVIMSNEYIETLSTLSEDGKFVRDISHGYQAFYGEATGIDGFYVHDASAVAYALHPEHFETIKGPVRVVDDGIAIGQTIVKPDGANYPTPHWDNRPSVTVCTNVNGEALLREYQAIISG